jgi:ribosomal protein L22
MAFGAKTNERPGVRCEVKYVRSSAYKAREILDLIRGLPVARALETLEFAERDIARTILKALESAIANAEHNNSIPADELYVSACFADEGPTWSPNGRVILFTRTTPGRGGAGGNSNIWSVDLTGQNLRRVITPGDASDPAWSPLNR